MQIGSQIPSVPVQQLVDGEIKQINLVEFSTDKTIVLVAVPGAFTPTCSVDHVPGYLENIEAFRKKGVDAIIVLATSDFFVVKAWQDQLNPAPNIYLMADGSQKFAKAANQLLDLTELGLGLRTQRYVALVRNGQVESFVVEPDATAVTVTAFDAVLETI